MIKGKNRRYHSKSGEKVKVLDQTKGLTENEAKQTIAAAHPEIKSKKLL